MALTSGQLTQISNLQAVGDSIGAVDYLIAQGYDREYAQQQVAIIQSIDQSKIVRGTFADRALILRPSNGLRYVVTSDGVNVEDYEGIEFIYTNGSWKNASGYEE